MLCNCLPHVLHMCKSYLLADPFDIECHNHDLWFQKALAFVEFLLRPHDSNIDWNIYKWDCIHKCLYRLCHPIDGICNQSDVLKDHMSIANTNILIYQSNHLYNRIHCEMDSQNHSIWLVLFYSLDCVCIV